MNPTVVWLRLVCCLMWIGEKCNILTSWTGLGVAVEGFVDEVNNLACHKYI